MFQRAFELTGLEPDLHTGKDLNIFVPVDGAFGSLDSDLLDGLLAGSKNEDLERLARHHIGPLPNSGDRYFRPKSGQRIPCELSGRLITKLGDARIVGVVPCENGTVFKIDRVLIPESRLAMEVLRDREEFSRFAELVDQAELENLLDYDWTFTLLVPTNDAFENLETRDPRTHKMLSERVHLERFIKSSVILGRKYGDEIRTLTEKPPSQAALSSFGGTRRHVSVLGNTLYIDRDPVAIEDVETSQGVIHGLSSISGIPAR